MRIGRIGYINCYPVYGAIDRGLVDVAGDHPELLQQLQQAWGRYAEEVGVILSEQ